MKRQRQRFWGEPVVYAFIFLAGLVFFIIQLQNWAIPRLTLNQDFVRARGTILDTRMAERSFEKEIRYRPEVLLRYSVNGIYYQRWTYDHQTLFSELNFSSDAEKTRQILSGFKADDVVDCWYSAKNPSEVFVVWESGIWGWFFLALSFSLTVLGAVGFFFNFRLSAFSEERKLAFSSASGDSPFRHLFEPSTSPDWPTIPDIRVVNESPGTHLAFRLPLGNRPLFPLIGIALFALAWNIVAWTILFQSFFHPAENRADQIIEVLLRSLFFGVGIILFVGVLRQVLQAFSLGLTLLEISDHPIYPGRRYRILLRQTGLLRFRRFAVDVACEEIARFHQGTDTITNRKIVFSQNLFEREDFETTAAVSLEQEFFLQLPLQAMHSFRMENNEVSWKLEIEIQIAGWPKIRRECPIVVRPASWNDSIPEGIGL